MKKRLTFSLLCMFSLVISPVFADDSSEDSSANDSSELQVQACSAMSKVCSEEGDSDDVTSLDEECRRPTSPKNICEYTR